MANMTEETNKRGLERVEIMKKKRRETRRTIFHAILDDESSNVDGFGLTCERERRDESAEGWI